MITATLPKPKLAKLKAANSHRFAFAVVILIGGLVAALQFGPTENGPSTNGGLRQEA